MSADRIEKNTLLDVPLERAWRAISDSQEFGLWFGIEFDGPFEAGKSIRGKIVPTIADAEVAKVQEPHRGFAFEFMVGAIDPMRRITFQWHPYAVDPAVDYSQEEMTDITFQLREVAGRVELTITESGFDHIPASRRAESFSKNENGWEHQLKLIRKYLVMRPG